MDKTLTDAWDTAERIGYPIVDCVVCDFRNADYIQSKEQGGELFIVYRGQCRGTL